MVFRHSEAISETTAPNSIVATPDDAKLWKRALLLVLLGLAIRLAIASNTVGSNDVRTWWRFGGLVEDVGLFKSYPADWELNHPPLPVMWAWLSRQISEELVRFGFVMKLPAIFADVVTCWLLWRIGRRRGGGGFAIKLVALMALNPLAILVSGYHGNTDNVYACLALLALDLADRRRLFWAGVAIGAAINVKLIPVLLGPALLASCRSWKDVGRLMIGGVLPMLVFLVPLIGAGSMFIDRVVNYRPNTELWGVSYLLALLGKSGALSDPAAARATAAFQSMGKPLMLGCIALSALWGWRRRADVLTMGAITACLFLVLAPGFGVQYLALPAVLLIAASPRLGLYFAAMGSLFIGGCYYYFLERDLPLRSQFRAPLPAPPIWIGLIAWGILVFAVVWLLARVRPAKRTLPVDQVQVRPVSFSYASR